MAKRFLESLGEAFEENVLEDVIPVAGGKRHRPPKKSSRRGRKKAILQALDEAFESQRIKQAEKPASKKSGKGFLQNLNKELGTSDLGDLIPSAMDDKSNFSSKASREALTRFTTSLDKKLLQQIRTYAKEHDLKIREVVQEAVKIFLEQEDLND